MTSRRLALAGATVAGLLALLAAGLCFVPWTLADAVLRRALLGQMARASGLTLAAEGPITVRLLPRPTVQLGSVAIRGLDGAVALDAEVMRGRLDLGALLQGRLKVVAAIFDRPTAVVELDRILPLLEAMHDRSAFFRLLQSGGLTMHGGVLRLHSSDSRHDDLLTMSAGRSSGPPTMPRVGWPAPRHGTASRPRSPPTWSGPARSARAGRRSPRYGCGPPPWISTRRAPCREARRHARPAGSPPARRTCPPFSASSATRRRSSNAIHAARMIAGATLTAGHAVARRCRARPRRHAVRGRPDRPSEGRADEPRRYARVRTCRSRPVLDALPSFTRPDGAWADAPLQTRSIADDDIDLRVSATTATLRTFTIEDGSFSLQSGSGRMELSLGEARAYDGLLKGRVVATAAGARTELRADVTLSRLDLEKLFKDVPGRYSAAGILTGHLTIESQGAARPTWPATLEGRGQLSLHNGAIGADLMAALIHPGQSASPVPSMPAGGFPPRFRGVRLRWRRWPPDLEGQLGGLGGRPRHPRRLRLPCRASGSISGPPSRRTKRRRPTRPSPSPVPGRPSGSTGATPLLSRDGAPPTGSAWDADVRPGEIVVPLPDRVDAALVFIGACTRPGGPGPRARAVATPTTGRPAASWWMRPGRRLSSACSRA